MDGPERPDAALPGAVVDSKNHFWTAPEIGRVWESRLSGLIRQGSAFSAEDVADEVLDVRMEE